MSNPSKALGEGVNGCTGCDEAGYEVWLCRVILRKYILRYIIHTVFLVTSKISTTKLTGHIDVTFNSIESNKKNNTK